MNFVFKLVGALAATTIMSVAQAATFDVYASANSSSGGTGLNTVSLLAGQSFSVTVSPTDLWNAGPLPRWSNADGLTGNLLATGTDESGQAAGTLIGQNFGMYSQGGLSAAFGTLVGQIGSGNFFVVGTNYSGVAASTGVLKLFYWDSNRGDNSQFVTATVTAVPEAGQVSMALAGLAVVGAGAFLRQRRQG